MKNCRYCKWLDMPSCPLRSFTIFEIKEAGKFCFDHTPWYITMHRWTKGDLEMTTGRLLFAFVMAGLTGALWFAWLLMINK